MGQDAMDGVTPFLPQEIVTDILKLLPVKSLIRFRCVCKYWKNLIKSPSFVEEHLHSSQHRPCLLFQPYYFGDRFHFDLLDCDMEIVKIQKIPGVGRVHIAGSSNGLLCLRIDSNISPSLLLWNPAFREVRPVPTTLPDFIGCCVVGFGFCPILKDYKILRTYVYNYVSEDDFYLYRGRVQKVPLVVEVYSLGLGSWKKIEVGNLLKGLRLNLESFSMNGTIFMFGTKQVTPNVAEFVIVSFDIATEVFEMFPGPDIKVGDAYTLTEFEQRLALLSSSSTMIGCFRYCLIGLWVLEESTSGSGKRWSWAKKFTSKTHPCMLQPKTIWRNEIACIFVSPDRKRKIKKTIMSNFTNTEVKVLFDHNNRIINYVESLVPISNIHIEDS